MHTRRMIRKRRTETEEGDDDADAIPVEFCAEDIENMWTTFGEEDLDLDRTADLLDVPMSIDHQVDTGAELDPVQRLMVRLRAEWEKFRFCSQTSLDESILPIVSDLIAMVPSDKKSSEHSYNSFHNFKKATDQHFVNDSKHIIPFQIKDKTHYRKDLEHCLRILLQRFETTQGWVWRHDPGVASKSFTHCVHSERFNDLEKLFKRHDLVGLNVFVDGFEAKKYSRDNRSFTSICISLVNPSLSTQNKIESKVVVAVIPSSEKDIQTCLYECVVKPLLEIREKGGLDVQFGQSCRGVTKRFFPVVFAILGDDPGLREVAKLAGWKAERARARFFADLWKSPGPEVDRSQLPDSGMPKKPLDREVRCLKALRQALDSFSPLQVTVARKQFLERYGSLGLKTSDVQNLEPTTFWKLDEIKEDFYFVFAPDLLHSWSLGIVKWLFRQIGRRYGVKFMNNINTLLSATPATPDHTLERIQVPRELRRNIYSPSNKDCLSMKGSLWNELLKIGGPLINQVISEDRQTRTFTMKNDKWKSPQESDEEKEKWLRIFDKANQIQSILFSSSFDGNLVSDLNERIWEFKCFCIRTMKQNPKRNGTKKKKMIEAEDEDAELDITFEFPNWETRTYDFLRVTDCFFDFNFIFVTFSSFQSSHLAPRKYLPFHIKYHHFISVPFLYLTSFETV